MEKGLIDITEIVLEFRETIRKSWPHVETLAVKDQSESLLQDWAQATWEILLEHTLSHLGNVRLEIYGEGADINGESSRVTFPADLPSHRVCCMPAFGTAAFDVLNKKEVMFPNTGHAFDRFVSIKDGWHYDSAPFDHALINVEGIDSVFKCEELKFFLSKLD